MMQRSSRGSAPRSRKPRSFLAALLAAASLIPPARAVADEWPQWRGLRRDGSVSTPFPTKELSDRLDRQWEREVGGGYSGPVVAGDRVWIHSRQEGREVVRSLRLGNGEVLWRQAYEAPFRQDDSALAHGLGPYATPALAGGRLFTFGINAVLSAWNAETGELLWRRESAKEFDPAFPYFGAAASPLVWKDLCFVHLGGHDRIEVAARGPMVALRVSDGREIWRWSGGGPAVGASPVIHQLEGGPQLVFKTFKTLVGLDPRTGEELWQVPFPVDMEDNTVVTPLPVGDRLVTSDWDVGMIALEIRRSGETWEARPAWKHREVSLSMSSPVLAGDLLVGFSHLQRGRLFVLDPEDGKVLWQGEPRNGEHASLISWDDRVLVVQEDGSLLLAEVSRKGLQPIKSYRLGRSVAWSHPAVASGRIIFRDGTRLAVSRLVR
jgi:outer membrane protein assembly factor BamB